MADIVLKEFQQLSVVNNVSHLTPTGNLNFEWTPRTETSPTHLADGTPIIYVSEPTDDARHVALGRFMDAWGRLEQSLRVLLGITTGVGIPNDHVLMSALGLRGTVDVLNVIGPANLSEQDQARLAALMARVKTNNTRRNNIVHGKWVLELRLYDWNGRIGTRAFQYRYYEPVNREEAKAIDPAHPKSKDVRSKYLFSVQRINSITAEVRRLTGDLKTFNRERLGLADGQRLYVIEHRPRGQ